MDTGDFSITPATKVAALLEHYPELEDVLIGMAPPFKKLKNPLLRKSVAKVASLRQAAAVGRLSVKQMVNDLRLAVGQDPIRIDPDDDAMNYYSPKPAWFDDTRLVTSIIEQEMDQNTMPINALVKRANELATGEMIELITNFLPAPGIDLMKNKGYRVWSVEQDGITKTYFAK